jgi:hypothetical protein
MKAAQASSNWRDLRRVLRPFLRHAAARAAAGLPARSPHRAHRNGAARALRLVHHGDRAGWAACRHRLHLRRVHALGRHSPSRAGPHGVALRRAAGDARRHLRRARRAARAPVPRLGTARGCARAVDATCTPAVSPDVGHRRARSRSTCACSFQPRLHWVPRCWLAWCSASCTPAWAWRWRSGWWWSAGASHSAVASRARRPVVQRAHAIEALRARAVDLVAGQADLVMAGRIDAQRDALMNADMHLAKADLALNKLEAAAGFAYGSAGTLTLVGVLLAVWRAGGRGRHRGARRRAGAARWRSRPPNPLRRCAAARSMPAAPGWRLAALRRAWQMKKSSPCRSPRNRCRKSRCT